MNGCKFKTACRLVSSQKGKTEEIVDKVKITIKNEYLLTGVLYYQAAKLVVLRILYWSFVNCGGSSCLQFLCCKPLLTVASSSKISIVG